MNPQIAFSKEFMEAYSGLPRKIQKKVREFTEKFQRGPTQSGLNFERIESAKDDKVRSVRVDQSYRVIVIHPPRGDVYLCVWVDHHDEAYRWVQDRRFEVNPRSGTFQIFEMAQEEESTAAIATVQAEAPAARRAPGLLDNRDDEDLLLAGIPEPLLASVRAIKTEDDLDALAPHLPADAGEMLYLLAAGYDLIDAMEEAARPEPEPVKVDVDDFAAALTHPNAQQSFHVIEDEADLETMLDAPLEQWRVFLHPAQRKLVQMNANGPVRVLGGAGTGKTVVLMHRANHLASKIFTGDHDRILVTTFTRNLALDLGTNLRNLCPPVSFGRLDITNLHSWAAGFMRKQGHSFRVAREHERRELFEEAMLEAPEATRSLEFYIEEWDRVVQAQEVQSRDDYLSARRTGRGTRLTRRQRAEVWVVLQRYRELLTDGGWHEWADVIRETRLYIEKQRIPLPYRTVLADEAQDFTASGLRLLRTLAPDAPNTLFLAGDGHQRIYGQPLRLSACGIEIRGRSRRLKLNYRTTHEIRNRAISILEGREIDDLDGGVDSLKGYRSLRSGPIPEVRTFESEAQEASFAVERVHAWLEAAVPSQAICLAARTRAQLADRYASVLESAGVECVLVEKDPEAEQTQPGVRLATMHRMKGLEFSRVMLVGVQKGTVPLELERAADEVSAEAYELQERCLFYVACTRARDELVIAGYGEGSRFLR